jgi:SAM-dependent methyltransferase
MIPQGTQAAHRGSPRPCPLCTGTAKGPDFPFRTVWRGRSFDYEHCGSCGCVFVDPLPTDEELSIMYAPENYHTSSDAPPVDTERYRRSALHLRELCGTRQTVLDFGCGNGPFMIAAQSFGFHCHGVEFQDSAIANAIAQTSLPVSDFASLQKVGARFDVVHLGDVFEHLTDPYGTVSALRRLLAPSGLFYVEGPLERNPSLVYYSSRAAKTLKRYLGLDAPASIPPWHLILVNRRAQERFFVERMGYKPVSFTVSEDGWPYVTPADRTGAAGKLKATIGRAAIALSRVKVRGESPFGNRFAALFQVD